MFSLPYLDNSFDVVYTCATIEQAPNDNKTVLRELYRVARKCVILFEPSYELGDVLQKKRHRRADYVRGLPKVIDELGWKMVEYGSVPISQYHYRLGKFVIEKETTEDPKTIRRGYICPQCRSDLVAYPDAYFCQKCGVSFPCLSQIPCLDKRCAILASKFGQVTIHSK
jgi:hypothetical protein